MKEYIKLTTTVILLLIEGIFLLIAAAIISSTNDIIKAILGLFIVLIPMVAIGFLIRNLSKGMKLKKEKNQKITVKIISEELKEEDPKPIKIPGTYELVHVDYIGSEPTKRNISNVEITGRYQFSAYDDSRQRVNGFLFSRVISIKDLESGQDTQNALFLFSTKTNEDIEKRFNVDVTKLQKYFEERFDNSTDSTTSGTWIDGEFDFIYTNSKTQLKEKYHISDVVVGNTRIAGKINYTQFRFSVMMKKISELTDCETGEIITENIAEYLRKKRK